MEAALRGFAGDEDELVAGQAGQMDRLAEARGHGAQMGAAELRNAPALPDGAAQLEEMVAEAIFPVGRILLHDGGVQHGGKQPVDRALGPAGPLLQLV